MVISMACFVVNDTMVKLLRVEWGPGQVLLIRGLFSLMVFGVWIALAGQLGKIRQVFHPQVAQRATLEAFVAYTFIAALGMMAIADITAILLAAPLLITAFSALFLQEKVGWRRWSAITLGFVGVVMVVQPGKGTIGLLALALAVLSTIGVAFRDLLTRRIDAEASSVVIALATTLGTVVVGAGLMFSEGVPVLTPGLLALAAMAAVMVAIGNYCVIEACRDVELSVVSPFRYTIILWAVLSGMLVFGEWPGVLALCGIGLIMASGLYTAHRERVRARNDRAVG